MPRFYVCLPYAGQVTGFVSARTADEALDIALDNMPASSLWVKLGDDYDDDGQNFEDARVEPPDVMSTLVSASGVCYAPLQTATVTEMDVDID